MALYKTQKNNIKLLSPHRISSTNNLTVIIMAANRHILQNEAKPTFSIVLKFLVYCKIGSISKTPPLKC